MLTIDRHLGTRAAKMLVKFQDDTKILSFILAASRLDWIWRQDVLPLSEYMPRLLILFSRKTTVPQFHKIDIIGIYELNLCCFEIILNPQYLFSDCFFVITPHVLYVIWGFEFKTPAKLNSVDFIFVQTSIWYVFSLWGIVQIAW